MIPDRFIAWSRLCLTGLLAAALVAVFLKGQATQRTPQTTRRKPAPAAKPNTPTVIPTLEPKAIDLLKETSSRLAAARTMSFTTVVMYESPSRLGPPLAYMATSDVTLQRPDKLRVITTADGPRSEFYYNGTTITAFSPVENLVAIASAPPTIDAALKAAYDEAAIYFPFTDLVVADPYKDINEDGLDNAFYIGQSQVVGGTTTNIIGYTTGGTFIQMWIGAEDKLPRMMRAVYNQDPSELRHQLEISNWQIDVPVAESTFATAQAASAKPIPFAAPEPKVPPGSKLPLQSPPSRPAK
jgi:hypothetical protein